MTGVEILSTAEVVSETTFNWTAFWIATGIFFIMALVLIIYVAITEFMGWDFIVPMLIIIMILSPLLGLPMGKLFRTPIAYETQHKVTINESVSMVEFLDKYEIIDQEGKIYTVREKK